MTDDALVDVPIRIAGSLGQEHYSEIFQGTLKIPKSALMRMISYARQRHYINIGLNCHADLPGIIRNSQLTAEKK